MTVETVLQLLGASQFIQAPATAILASDRVLALRAEIQRLSPVNRAIVRVLGAAVVVVLVALGALFVLYPTDAARTDLGRALMAFLGVFWSARFFVQLWYGRRWPARARPWHWFLCVVFAVQGPGYCLAWTASRSGRAASTQRLDKIVQARGESARYSKRRPRGAPQQSTALLREIDHENP
ncbi:MAG TPA: hypothetical protein VGY54_17790 [Polyangiaceae bacterium]|nr:hypothetical protein [Polyangiaceae bacterium]